MDLELTGKRAIVTGGSSGIGFEIAKALAREGANVTVTGQSTEVEQSAAELRRINPDGTMDGLVVDFSGDTGVEALFAAVPDIDILVNNVGAYEAKAFGEIADADWQRLFQVNVMSGVRCSRHYLPGMLERDWGRVLFTSSEAALTVPVDMIHYAMTKTAQLTVVRGLAEMTTGSGVTVNAVMPGPTRSPGVEKFFRDDAKDPDAPFDEIERAYFAEKRPGSLLRRLVKPEEIANLMVYLASPLAAASNGAAFRADGGIVSTIV